ncbi:hypothetical protein ALP89_200050 [Pseudomonas syringae pv. persicae]|nr:hypothetical protein ALP89_200050 [Pseudomonas syringae pv. persicae]
MKLKALECSDVVVDMGHASVAMEGNSLGAANQIPCARPDCREIQMTLISNVFRLSAMSIEGKPIESAC